LTAVLALAVVMVMEVVGLVGIDRPISQGAHNWAP
jgi:hypothetical protein